MGIETGEVGVTADSVKVAIIVSLTGNNNAGHSGFEQGLEAYFDNLNDKGGICGRTIEYETYDDTSEPTVQSELFEKAVTEDGAFMVLGSWPNFGGAEYGDANGIPAVGTRYTNGWDYSDNFFGVTGGSWEAPNKAINDLPQIPPDKSATGPIDLYLMARTGATTAATFGYTHAGSSAAARTACETIDTLKWDGVGCESNGGFWDGSVEFGFSTIGAIGAKVKDAGATYFYAGMDLAGCVTYSNELKKAGVDDFLFRCAVGIGAPGVEDYGEALLPLIIMLTTPDFESTDPAMVEFVDNLDTWKPGEDPSITSLAGWQSGIFFEDVMTILGADVTREGFITTGRTNEKFEAWDAGGLLGSPINWTVNRHQAVLDGTYEPAGGCSGTLWRFDASGQASQVGPDVLCLGGLSGDEIVAYADADTSSLEVG